MWSRDEAVLVTTRSGTPGGDVSQRVLLLIGSRTKESLEALVRARLVTLDSETVEITHEALLHAWPRLRDWIDEDKTKIGYEIPSNRHFYVFKPPRPLAEIDAELKGVTDRILDMIRTVPNVTCDLSIATAVARWENEIDVEEYKSAKDV